MVDENEISNFTARRKARQAGQKLLYDTCKHLTTLNTGSIVVLATFLEKLFPRKEEREWDSLVAVVFSAFIISMISSVATMLALSRNIFYFREATETGTRTGMVSVFISVGAFIVGIITLVLFVLKNYY
jgi:hypothetical protein